jgi:hypothetical protein
VDEQRVYGGPVWRDRTEVGHMWPSGSAAVGVANAIYSAVRGRARDYAITWAEVLCELLRR